MSDAPLYVYGVLAASEREALSVTGVEGSTVSTVEHNKLAALISPLKGRELRAAREVRAHLSVLEQASESATVLPVRFGTVLDGEQAVRERLLQPNAAQLEAMLEQLAGCVQMTVKGDYDEEAVIREIVSASPPLRALNDRVRQLPEAAAYYERLRLGEAIAAAVQQRRDADAQRALDVLEPAALGAQPEAVAAPHEAFSLSFLVRRSDRERFDRGVDNLVGELGDRVAIRYVGPLPPYSFAQGELEAA